MLKIKNFYNKMTSVDKLLISCVFLLSLCCILLSIRLYSLNSMIINQNKTVNELKEDLEFKNIVVEDLNDKKNVLIETNVNLEKNISELTKNEEKYLSVIDNQKNQIDDITYKRYPINDKIVFLTFDDGPSSNTEKILDTLHDNKIPATFFVNGNTTDYGKDLYKRIVNEGHTLGNHTFSHNYSYIYSSSDKFIKDFKILEELIYDATDIKPNIYRFPGGSNTKLCYRYTNENVIANVKSKLYNEGYVYFDWNASSGDADIPICSKEKMILNATRLINKKKHIIVLMHDSSSKNATTEILPAVIKKYKDNGYKFDKLSSIAFDIQFE